MSEDHRRALVAKATDSLDIARLLVSTSHFAVAASRAYYAMFYLAETLLLTKGLTYSSHAAVIGAFGLHFAKAGLAPRHLHRYLMKGFEVRQTGDYGTQAVSREAAEQVISWAEEFMAAAKDYLATDPGNP